MAEAYKRIPLVLILLVSLSPGFGIKIERKEKLDDEYEVKWTADLVSSSIEFQVIVNTTGYVGFGLSTGGCMEGADIVIGGVRDGAPYFSDRHGVGNSVPEVDDRQDWRLTYASENATHTTLAFSRDFDTCDKDDLPINNDTVRFIWAIGATDDIQQHIKHGTARVNVLDPAQPAYNASEYDVWHLNVSTAIPRGTTIYWCTLHESPEYLSKLHIVGFKVKLDNPESIAHNHHLILHHCTGTTPELRDYYKSFVGRQGGQCYFDQDMLELMNSCEQYFYGWAMGGSPLFLPSDVGFPLNELDETEFFLLEIHYDNPNSEHLQYETGLEIYTTAELRKHDAGALMIGHDVRFTLTIPPITPNFTIVGHCGSVCTQRKMPTEGITIFSVLLHSHMAGRKLKLRHFRNGVELPWVMADNNFDFSHQESRGLPEYRQIQRGDHLTYGNDIALHIFSFKISRDSQRNVVHIIQNYWPLIYDTLFECTDDSTYLEPPQAIIGGLSTHNEMCQSFLMYYPRINNLYVCGSYFGDKDALSFLNLETEEYYNPLDPKITAPPQYSGKQYSDVVSNFITWNEAMKRDLQNIARFGNHTGICGSFLHGDGTKGFRVGYPQFSPYFPSRNCTEHVPVPQVGSLSCRH